MDKAELIKFADKVIDKYKAAAVDNLGYIAIHKYINVKDKRWAIDEECKALRCDFLKLLDADNESEAEYEKVADAYQNNIAPMTTIVRESILDWLDNMDADVIVWAIGEAVKNNVRTWRYIEAILRNHFNAGRTTLATVKSAGRPQSYSTEKDFEIYKSDVDHDALARVIEEKLSK